MYSTGVVGVHDNNQEEAATGDAALALHKYHSLHGTAATIAREEPWRSGRDRSNGHPSRRQCNGMRSFAAPPISDIN